MRIGIVVGILGAVVVHLAILLFGGVLFLGRDEGEGTTREVELLTDVDDTEKEPPREAPPVTPDEPPEEIPDAAEVIRGLETPPADNTPRLDDASLAAIEQALGGQPGTGFGDALSFASGGRIGGTGRGGLDDEKVDEAFSLAEIDQPPRVVHQPPVDYPSEMRGRKVEGQVTVIFVVDEAGKVTNARVEKSSNPAFEKPALAAVKQWRFEPGVKGGQRVSSRMRVPIRFQPR